MTTLMTHSGLSNYTEFNLRLWHNSFPQFSSASDVMEGKRAGETFRSTRWLKGSVSPAAWHFCLSVQAKYTIIYVYGIRAPWEVNVFIWGQEIRLYGRISRILNYTNEEQTVSFVWFCHDGVPCYWHKRWLVWFQCVRKQKAFSSERWLPEL